MDIQNDVWLRVEYMGGRCGSWRREMVQAGHGRPGILRSQSNPFPVLEVTGATDGFWASLEMLRKLSGTRERQKPGTTYSQLENTADNGVAWCPHFFLIETTPMVLV